MVRLTKQERHEIAEQMKGRPGQRCFACDRDLSGKRTFVCETIAMDQTIYVGAECYRRIKKSKTAGYQPPKGGPKLIDTFGN